MIKVPPGRSYFSCDSKIFQKLLNNMPVYCLEKRGPSQGVALDMSKTFESVWLAGFLHKLKRYGMFFVRLSFLFFQVPVMFYFVLLWMGSLYKSALLMMRSYKAPFPWLYCFLNPFTEGVMLATKASMRSCWSDTEMQGPKLGQFFLYVSYVLLLKMFVCTSCIVAGLLVILKSCIILLSPFLGVTTKTVPTISFCAQKSSDSFL